MGSNQEAFDWMCQQMRKMRAEMEEMRTKIQSLDIEKEPVLDSEPEEEWMPPRKTVRVIFPGESLFDPILGKNTICRVLHTLFQSFKSYEFLNVPLKVSVSHENVFAIHKSADADIIVLMSIRLIINSKEEYQHPPVMPILGNADGSWYKGNAKVIIWPITLVTSVLFSASDLRGHYLMMYRDSGIAKKGGIYYRLGMEDGRLVAMQRELKKVLN